MHRKTSSTSRETYTWGSTKQGTVVHRTANDKDLHWLCVHISVSFSSLLLGSYSVHCIIKHNFLFSFIDLKKTLAVLLDNILQRIGKLESKVENLVLNGTGANSTNNTSTTPAPSLGAVEKLNVAGGYGSTCGLFNLHFLSLCNNVFSVKEIWSILNRIQKSSPSQ